MKECEWKWKPKIEKVNKSPLKHLLEFWGTPKFCPKCWRRFRGVRAHTRRFWRVFPALPYGVAGQDAALRQRASVRLYKVKEILARWREGAKSTETRCKPRWISRTNGRTTCHEKSRHSHSIRGFWPFQDFRCHGLGKWRSLLYAKMQYKMPMQMFFWKIAKNCHIAVHF